MLNAILNSEFLIQATDKLYVQSNLETRPFESAYIKTREKEHQLYTDEIVLGLPKTPSNNPNRKEWKIREKSSELLLKYLKRMRPKSVLDIGCGNGWFTNLIATQIDTEVIGIDINRLELEQGAKVFNDTKNMTFVYANVMDEILSEKSFDCVVLAASVQYFPDINHLLSIALDILKENGEIHILDSPFYTSPKTVNEAKKRSMAYFNSLNVEVNYYHHHMYKEIEPFNSELLYDPWKFTNRVKRKLRVEGVLPFPWIKIKHY